MKIFTLIIFLILSSFITTEVIAQANAYVNILTQNSGQVNSGGTVFIEVTVGNSGPASAIGINKLRAQISVPSAIASIPAMGHILPSGWTITVNTGSAITVCNGSDIIAVGTARTILISVQGNTIGGPSTVSANLLFSSGSSCTAPGSLPGDNTADNSSTSSIQVLAGCPLAVTGSAGTILCHGETTTLTATATSATGVIEYSVNSSPYQAGNTFTVPAGTYIINAREAASTTCIATSAPVTITEPLAVPQPIIDIIQPTCVSATGTISITSATTGLLFSLDGDPYTVYPAGGYAVIAGNHTLLAKNAGNCISANTNTTVNPQPPTPSIPVIGNIIQPTCAISTGSVNISGLPAGNWTINPVAITGSGTIASLTNLAPGLYNFTVTNEASCTSAASATVVIDAITGVPDAPAINIIQPTCTIATGNITITSETAGLTFSLDGGNYDAYPIGGYTVAAGVHTLSAQNTGSCISPIVTTTVNAQPGIPEAPMVAILNPTCTVATGTIAITSQTTGLTFSLDGGAYDIYPTGGFIVAAGLHTLTAQNAGTCVSPVINITVDVQPATPTATLSAGSISCFGGTTILTVNASGGTAPYEYSINGGAFQTANSFTVGAGSYTVTVKDVYPCSTVSAAINIVEPTVIIATTSAGIIACNGGTTTLTVNASGGTTPYQYSLSGGAYQQNNSFNVSAGVHNVIVKDANACTQIVTSATVIQPSTLIVTATAPWIPTCGGTTIVTVSASGGTAPFTGTGTYVKGPGTWNFTVTDAAGCTAASNLLIEAPGCLELEVFPNPANNFININHSIAEAGAVMQVFEINGALLISQTVPVDAFFTTINTRNLAAGVYVLVYLNGKDKKPIRFKKINR